MSNQKLHNNCPTCEGTGKVKCHDHQWVSHTGHNFETGYTFYDYWRWYCKRDGGQLRVKPEEGECHA